MKTFSRVAIATLTMLGVAGVAGAQPKAPEKAPAPMPKTDKPGATPATPATPAKPGDKAAGTPAGTPAKLEKMTMPPAPPEIADMAKTAAGVWRCKGDEFDQKGAKGAMTATNTIKLDLDKWWMVETMEAKGRMNFKMVAYTTYDPTSKKWRRLAVMNDGGQMIGTSDGVKEGKMTWNLDVVGPMGSGMMRDTMDMSDPKAGVKGRGEISMDKGKTWLPVYEMTCKK
jgi:hypothetical protein